MGSTPMMPEFGPSLFICSKPLQFLACAAIVRRFAVSKARLFIITRALAQSDDFLSFLLSSRYFCSFYFIHLLPDHSSAAQIAKEIDYESLFL